MNWVKYLSLLAGAGLLAALLLHADLAGLVSMVERAGSGISVIALIYLVAFCADTYSWQLTLTAVSPSLTWSYRLLLVRLAGEAFNSVTPLAGFGGEPIKALMLKRRYLLPYRDTVASLVLARTINVLGLVVFLAAGFALVIGSAHFGPHYQGTAALGLAAFSTGALLFYLLQRYKVASRVTRTIAHRALSRRVSRALRAVEDFDDRVARFYTLERLRFYPALALALSNWILGAVEVYYTMVLIGRPISFAEAWIAESLAQMVRTGAFFIPAGIGVQEGTFVAAMSAITGTPAHGLAVAAIRRLRELAWIAWGMGVFHLLGFRRSDAAGARAREPVD